MEAPKRIKRIAFISTRIAGTDGVSLEIDKWSRIIERVGFECFYIAGSSNHPPEKTAIIEEAHFEHPAVIDISRRSFGTEERTSELSDDILNMARVIRDKINIALEQFQIDAIIAENALTLPMNIPLGVAIVHSVLEKGIGCLAHHHDFYWERDRYLISAIDDILRYAYPPALPQIQHVVINTLASQEFSRRTGLSCRIIPNVMDYASPPPEPDDYARQFREELGLARDDILILQPTRVVARKGIEHSVELARRLDPKRAKLVITHATGDEGDAYTTRIRDVAKFLNVELIFANDRIAHERGTDQGGRKIFSIGDAYSQADLIAYPSEYEGFGNAFLEAVYYKKPIICNRYSIFRTDIEPCGFHPVLFERYLTTDTVENVRRILTDRDYRRKIVKHNYQVAARFFGFHVVEQELRTILSRPQNIYRVIRRVQRGVKPLRGL